MADPRSDLTMPLGSKYVNERLEALYDRVSTLEVCVANAATALQDRQSDAAMEILQQGLVESFRSALLCSAEATDEQLDLWLPEILDHEAQQAQP